MTEVPPLPPSALRRSCDRTSLPFETTEELEPLDEVLGQDRALESIRFGLGIRRKGYNVFALGPIGSGRHTVVGDCLEREAASGVVPDDWCYVHDFGEAHRPRALRLPPGRGPDLRDRMTHLVEDLRLALPAAFEGDAYRERRAALQGGLEKRQEEVIREVQRFAEERSIGVAHGPMGFALAVLRDGQVLAPKEVDELEDEEKARIQEDMELVSNRLKEALQQVPRWQKEHRERVRELDRETTRTAVGHLIAELRERYPDLPDVLDHLDRVQADILVNARLFLAPQKAESELPRADFEPSPLTRYAVNVMVSHDDGGGAPIVTEDHPNVGHLLGSIEHVSRLGTLTTDFTLIKPGALHRANGGYLILEARKVLAEPFAWEQLKRALRSQEIRIEPLGQLLGLVSTASLEPEPIPLDLKVVLIGERRLYYLLSELDPELGEHFKVAADFDDVMEREDGRVLAYARLIQRLVRDKELVPFHRDAVSRVLERAARWADDADRLSTNIRQLSDLLVEADYWARDAGREVARAEDVEHAIESGIRRLDRMRHRVLELIEEGILRVETRGEVVGQVNALSVRMRRDFAFGHPSRVTARVRLGRGELLDIEREVELGGPIHSKGVLILGGFLAGRFARDRPMSLAASLVFEQSYAGVDGDSASLAELCALLSALSEVPIRQSRAVTGSVDQLGRVQAVGGISEKIEGFHDACGATGGVDGQGVIIPATNTRHVMLRNDVMESIEAERFFVWPVSTVEEALELLTGLEAGVPDERGRFPAGSLFRRVEARLATLADAARRAAGGDDRRP